MSAVPERPHRDNGFTIIEVMAASSVILIVMVSLAYVVTQSLTDVAFARQRQDAVAIMNKTMEQVRALPFTQLRLGVGLDAPPPFQTESVITCTPVGACGALGPFSPPGATPQITPQTVTLNSGQSNPLPYTVTVWPTTYAGSVTGLVRVTVVVSWTNPFRRGLLTSVSSQSVFSGLEPNGS